MDACEHCRTYGWACSLSIYTPKSGKPKTSARLVGEACTLCRHFDQCNLTKQRPRPHRIKLKLHQRWLAAQDEVRERRIDWFKGGEPDNLVIDLSPVSPAIAFPQVQSVDLERPFKSTTVSGSTDKTREEKRKASTPLSPKRTGTSRFSSEASHSSLLSPCVPYKVIITPYTNLDLASNPDLPHYIRSRSGSADLYDLAIPCDHLDILGVEAGLQGIPPCVARKANLSRVAELDDDLITELSKVCEIEIRRGSLGGGLERILRLPHFIYT